MNNNISDAKLEKVMNMVSQLLKVTTENGATENEAIEAALKVQKIMAKYDISLSDVECKSDDISEVEVKTSNDTWRIRLAVLIANNFCCKVYGKGVNICFYGYNRHTAVASEVFKSIYEFGRKRAKEVFKEYRDRGYDVHGIKNTFYLGFCDGVKNALDVQSRALMIITPPEVEEAFHVKMTGCRTKKANMKMARNSNVYAEGYAAGQEVTSHKTIDE